MATNLRLQPDEELALRSEAERTGRSQQEIIRAALDRYLGLTERGAAGDLDRLLATRAVLPPRTAYRSVRPSIRPRKGASSRELLDRDDRV